MNKQTGFENTGAGLTPPGSDDRRLHSPSSKRNREPILKILKKILPAKGKVLEIASGSGEHAAFLAPHFPALEWQPTDTDPRMLPSIKAWIESVAETSDSGINIHPPIELNTCEASWPVEQAEVMIAINMIHISPWSSCEGLMRGAGRTLSFGGVLYLYGPFTQDGRHTALSNAEFDASLRRQDPRWGVRNLEDVVELGKNNGLDLDRVIDMPANNLSVVFRRA